MKKIITALFILTLANCGGGGGGSDPKVPDYAGAWNGNVGPLNVEGIPPISAQLYTLRKIEFDSN